MFSIRAIFLLSALPLIACENQPAVNPATSYSQMPAMNAHGCAPDNGGISLPDGFCAVVFADNLGRGRHLAVRDNGDVYLAIRGGDGGIVGLRDTNGDAVADVVEKFADVGGTGIGIRNGYLYFAPDIAVVRMRLGDGVVPIGQPEIIVGGFAQQRTHAVKPFEFDGDGNMYVNVGAPSNACQKADRAPGAPGEDPCSLLERVGGVWRFDADLPGQHAGDGERYATGIRNGVANAWNDRTGKLYVVQHGRDQLSAIWPRLYSVKQSAELPAEEMFEVDSGDDFGWPYCYYDHLQQRKVLAPEYGGRGEEVGRCADKEGPIVAFPGHWAPNDLVFYHADQFPARYQGGAFIAFHGSWNRQPFVQQGYNVTFAPFVDGRATGAYEVFADGFAAERDLRSPREARYRPTGLAVGPDGSLYVADSVRGRVWRVFYRPGA